MLDILIGQAVKMVSDNSRTCEAESDGMACGFVSELQYYMNNLLCNILCLEMGNNNYL